MWARAAGPAVPRSSRIARRPRVAEHHAPGRHHVLAQRGLPGPARRRSLDLADDDLDDAIEQVVLVADVAVERHGIDAELLAELAHAQRLDAASIGERPRPPGARGRGSTARGAR